MFGVSIGCWILWFLEIGKYRSLVALFAFLDISTAGFSES